MSLTERPIEYWFEEVECRDGKSRTTLELTKKRMGLTMWEKEGGCELEQKIKKYKLLNEHCDLFNNENYGKTDEELFQERLNKLKKILPNDYVEFFIHRFSCNSRISIIINGRGVFELTIHCHEEDVLYNLLKDMLVSYKKMIIKESNDE